MGDFRLKVFVNVARELSFTKASKALHVSQPAISKHIQELEAIYGVQLFVRKGSGIELSVAGERFLILAEEILEKYHILELEMSVVKGDVSGELRVGASSTIAQYVLPKILAQFSARYKDVKVVMTTGNSEQIEQALAEKKIDLGLVEGGVKRRDFHYQIFAKDEIVLVTSVKNRIAQEVDVDIVQRLPIVLRESGSGSLEVILSALEKIGVKFLDLNLVLQLGSTESIKEYLINSDAFAFVSIAAVSRDLLDGRLKIVDVSNFEITRNFSFITNQGTQNSLVDRFIEFSQFHYNL